ncbi:MULTISPECIES: ABC transporter permease [Haloarcula]|uniref:ABC transporter permease n=1 Tax=Haloarcula TaxID=2237 RepID=UPI0023ECAFE9|nr:ABC transporter permease [Halomicroarcula sp. XH51]
MTSDDHSDGSRSDPAVESDGGYTSAAATGELRADGGRLRLPDWPVLTVAAREYRLAVRSRWALGVVLLFGLFSGAVVQFGATSVGPGRFDAVVATLAELGVYLVPLAALAFGYDTIVGADEQGSLELLLSLPVSQGRVVTGAYLGRSAVLGGAMLLGFVPGALLTVRYLGLGSLGTYAAVALTAVLMACAVLAVAVLVSTLVAEKAHALGVALALWLWMALLHDLVALGVVATLDAGGTAVAAAVLLNPVDCFRVLALSQVDVVAGGFGAVMAQAGLSVPVVGAALLGWTVVPMALASRAISRRRL